MRRSLPFCQRQIKRIRHHTARAIRLSCAIVVRLRRRSECWVLATYLAALIGRPQSPRFYLRCRRRTQIRSTFNLSWTESRSEGSARLTQINGPFHEKSSRALSIDKPAKLGPIIRPADRLFVRASVCVCQSCSFKHTTRQQHSILVAILVVR